ncbi:hypothetical protein EDD37DRAFT_654105 [Exophiala viscosa]|uniref:uncharacterized protein n=1 Tax=Exophiala viscosa TaxID=2486360 RepID=UPI00219DD391|nr:hypothetical protein EDD37DRAFT_654105 [Exophiala viscosa]
MALPRSAALRSSLRSATLKRTTTQARTTLRDIGRRTYAESHTTKKSSDLPWLIGSVVFTVPAAGWLLQQGPKTSSDHGHGETEPHEVSEEAPAEESEEEPEEEGEEESKDEDKEDNADKKSGGTTEPEDQTAGSPDGKERHTTESAGDKQKQGDMSGASNPFLGDGDRSKKPEGPAATARIHGTVDTSQRPTMGHKDPEKSQPHGRDEDKPPQGEDKEEKEE